MNAFPVFETVSTAYMEYLATADPRTKNWFLLYNSPKYVLTLTAFYLILVFLLPRYMKTRPAFNIPVTVIFLYNMGLVGLSLFIAIETGLSLYHLKYNLLCDAYNGETIQNPEELRMASVLWWFFFSKVIELADTILIRLRKKDSQVTFLHVFHHTSMLNLWWWTMMFMPGGGAYFGCMLNSAVHAIMYTYYGLAVIPSMKKYLWWKNWITKLQLIQFVAVFFHSAQLFRCDFPLAGPAILTSYMATLFLLFTNFYVKTYNRRHDKSSQAMSSSHEGVGRLHKLNGISKCSYMNGITGGELFKKNL